MQYGVFGCKTDCLTFNHISTMLRGMITVTCPHCGKSFVAPDIEYGATVESAPVTCPNCKQTVNPNINRAGLWGIIRELFKQKDK